MKDFSIRDKLNCLLGPIFLDMSTKRIFQLPDETVKCIYYTSVKRAVMVKTLYEQTPNHVMVSTRNLVKLPSTMIKNPSFRNLIANATIAKEAEAYEHYLQTYWTESSSTSSSKSIPNDQQSHKKRQRKEAFQNSPKSYSPISSSSKVIDELDVLHSYKFDEGKRYLSSDLCRDSFRLLRGDMNVESLKQKVTVLGKKQCSIKTIIKKRRTTTRCTKDLLEIEFILSLGAADMVVNAEEAYGHLSSWDLILDLKSGSVTSFKKNHPPDDFIYCFNALLTRVVLLLKGITDTLLCFFTILVTCCFVLPCTAIMTVAEELNEAQKERNVCIMDLSGNSGIEKELLDLSMPPSKFPNSWRKSHKTVVTTIVATTQAANDSLIKERQASSSNRPTSSSNRQTSPSHKSLDYIRDILDNLRDLKKTIAFSRSINVQEKCPRLQNETFNCPIAINLNRQKENQYSLYINFSIQCVISDNPIRINLIAVEGKTFDNVWDLLINSPTEPMFKCYEKDTILFGRLLQHLLITVAEMIAGIDTLCFIIFNQYIALLCPVDDYNNLMFFFKYSITLYRI